MGKWLAVLAALGTVIFTALWSQRNKINWNKMINQSMNMMDNRNVKRMFKRGRKMLARWI